jgi:structural maintenance of chromosome 1
MRNQRAGQATFILLDTIQVKPVDDKFRSFAKGSRLAVDAISCDVAVERHHACGNALVCDTMEVVRYVCYEKGQEIKGGFPCVFWWVFWLFWLLVFGGSVTLEGTVIHKTGLITGGRSSQSTGKKWEEKDVLMRC